MYEKEFLHEIMNDKCSIPILTICGSAKFRELKEKYQAYYTIKNNLVFIPVKYLAIKDEVETKENSETIANNLASAHDRKIILSEGIIVVTDENKYYGLHTAREIQFARYHGRAIIFTHVHEYEKYKYHFNNDETYPLYILKEEYR